jgi:curved DNA-binding protein CbpA
MARDQLSDMYDVLGVPRDADALSIRRVFREKARALRMDVSRESDAGELFRELTHAYAVLSNSRSRLLYDRLAFPGAGGGGLGHVGDDELSAWVFGNALADEPQTRPTRLPEADLLVRSLAAVGFVTALLLLVVLLVRG